MHSHHTVPAPIHTRRAEHDLRRTEAFAHERFERRADQQQPFRYLMRVT